MTGDELSAALASLGLEPGEFAAIRQADRRNVQRWLAGETEIPKDIPILLAVLAVPGALEAARAELRNRSH